MTSGSTLTGSVDAGSVQRISWYGVGWLVLYAVGLGLSEYFVIGPPFHYFGFEHADPNWALAIVFLVPYALCAKMLPRSWDRPSTIAYWMLFLIVVASVHVMPVFTPDLHPSTWFMVGSIDLAFWMLGWIYALPLKQVPRVPRAAFKRLTPRVFWILFGLLGAGLAAVVLSRFPVPNKIPSLTEIYDVRGEYRQRLAETSLLGRYAVTWLGNVIAPIAIARGVVVKGKWPWAVAGIGLELVLFTITGFKQLLFASVLIVGVVLFVRFTDVKKVGARVAPLVAAGVVLITSSEWLMGTYKVSSILIRRLMLTAGLNTQYYFEFFTEHEKAFLGYGLLNGIFDYPYALTPAYLMGLVYYGNPTMSANANVFADAYANFGVGGVLAFTAILGAVLYLTDCVSSRLLPGIGLAALASMSFSLANTALLTVLLTHGMLLAIAVLYLMPAEPPGGKAAVEGAPGPEGHRRREPERRMVPPGH